MSASWWLTLGTPHNGPAWWRKLGRSQRGVSLIGYSGSGKLKSIDWDATNQLISLMEKLKENPIFHGKI